MRVVDVDGKKLLLDDISSILVKCSSETGYFTDSANDVKVTSFSMILLKSELARLTIEPYFIQRDFQILYGVVIDKVFLDLLGAHEITCVKFVGESETNFTNFFMQVRRKAIKSALLKDNGIIGDEINSVFKNNAVKVSMYPAINKQGNRYNAVSFALEPLPEDYKPFAVTMFSPEHQKLIKEPQSISLARWYASNPSSSSSSSPSAKLKNQSLSNSLDIF